MCGTLWPTSDGPTARGELDLPGQVLQVPSGPETPVGARAAPALGGNLRLPMHCPSATPREPGWWTAAAPRGQRHPAAAGVRGVRQPLHPPTSGASGAGGAQAQRVRCSLLGGQGAPGGELRIADRPVPPGGRGPGARRGDVGPGERAGGHLRPDRALGPRGSAARRPGGLPAFRLGVQVVRRHPGVPEELAALEEEE